MRRTPPISWLRHNWKYLFLPAVAILLTANILYGTTFSGKDSGIFDAEAVLVSEPTTNNATTSTTAAAASLDDKSIPTTTNGIAALDEPTTLELGGTTAAATDRSTAQQIKINPRKNGKTAASSAGASPSIGEHTDPNVTTKMTLSRIPEQRQSRTESAADAVINLDAAGGELVRTNQTTPAGVVNKTSDNNPAVPNTTATTTSAKASSLSTPTTKEKDMKNAAGTTTTTKAAPSTASPPTVPPLVDLDPFARARLTKNFSVPTEVQLEHSMPRKCNYTERDLQWIQISRGGGRATVGLSPKPQSEAELAAIFGPRGTVFRSMTSELDVWDETVPFLNATTVIPKENFHSGFRNQMMLVYTFFMKVHAAGMNQVILQSLRHADLYNRRTGAGIRHQDLFDVKHWNSHYPLLPRLVHCDPLAFPEYNCMASSTNEADYYPEVLQNQDCVTQPYQYRFCYPTPWINFRQFQSYQKREGPLMHLTATDEWPNPVHRLMLTALRPHPDLMRIAELHLTQGMQVPYNNNNNEIRAMEDPSIHKKKPSYMAIHPRIEPDMVIKEFGCPALDAGRVRTLDMVLQLVEQHWPEPPVEHVFLPINRNIIESYSANKTDRDRERLASAKTNRQRLDRVLERGMWGGRVKVFEFGTRSLAGTKYELFEGICGAAVDYELAKQAGIFVGCPHSSFSVDLATDRFFRRDYANYFFNATGVYSWTNDSDEYPPHLLCCDSVPGKCAGIK